MRRTKKLVLTFYFDACAYVWRAEESVCIDHDRLVAYVKGTLKDNLATRSDLHKHMIWSMDNLRYRQRNLARLTTECVEKGYIVNGEVQC